MVGTGEGAERLVELAKQRSFARRRRLHSETVDLFLPEAHRLNDRERATMSGILRKLLADIEMDIRRALALRIAEEKRLPAELVAVLNDSEVEWARAILADAGVLQDAALIEQIDGCARAHRLGGFLRQSATEPDEGDAAGVEDVVETLLRHGDPTVSKRAMELLVAEARGVDRYREPLLHRADLPPNVAELLYWHLAASLRVALLRNFALDPLVLDDLIESAAGSALAARRDGEVTALQAARLLVERLRALDMLRPAVIVHALRFGHIALAAEALAGLSRLETGHALRLLLDSDGENLAIVCKAHAIERADFALLLDLLTKTPETRGVRAETGRILTFFDQLSAAQAATVCRQWRLHPGYKRAVESLTRNA